MIKRFNLWRERRRIDALLALCVNCRWRDAGEILTEARRDTFGLLDLDRAADLGLLERRRAPESAAYKRMGFPPRAQYKLTPAGESRLIIKEKS